MQVCSIKSFFLLFWVLLTVFFSYEMVPISPLDSLPVQSDTLIHLSNSKIKGIALVAPPDSFNHPPFNEICQLGAEWVSIVPYAFAPKGSAGLQYDVSLQWWGERPEGVHTSIRLAHEKGLKVMLKPHVYIPGGWVGHLKFDTREEWEEWEKRYSAYVLQMAEMAEEEKVELFCFSTEFKHSILLRYRFWSRLIEQVRAVYHGKLTFSANWDYFEEIPFWAKMDVIGVSAYFPLSESRQPAKHELLASWQQTKLRLQTLSRRYNKQILFTEYGYLSVDFTAKGHWILEPDIDAYKVNYKAQAVALDALYESFWDEPWWAGGFLWKWYPNNLDYTGFPKDKDYTPQGKPSIQVIKKWYKDACN